MRAVKTDKSTLKRSFFRFPENSGYSILLHGVISLPEATSYDKKILSGTLSECQIQAGHLSDLIWVQTVCKCYQQMTLAGKELKGLSE